MKNNNNKRFVTLNTMYVQSKLKNEMVLYNYSRINSSFEKKRIDRRPSFEFIGFTYEKIEIHTYQKLKCKWVQPNIFLEDSPYLF